MFDVFSIVAQELQMDVVCFLACESIAPQAQGNVTWTWKKA